MFNCYCMAKTLHRIVFSVNKFQLFFSYMFSLTSLQYFYLLFCFCFLIQSWDIESNPGPESEKSLSVCHWNLNSVWVEDFSKLAHISAFLNVHQFDIFCLSETFLDSSISNDDSRLAIDGYNLLRCDNPSDSRRGGVCLYSKDYLSIVRRSDLTPLDECLVCEVTTGKKRLFLTLIYRSPSQSAEQFSQFKQKWEETIININNCSPTVSIFVGDFNARNSDW